MPKQVETKQQQQAPLHVPPPQPTQYTYPGIKTVIHGNGAVAHVMGQVCGGVIGYPITPSTEISELYEAYRAQGGCNVWGRHPFFFEPEGEHSAQSGALAAALTGGKYISNASSSQGILYGLESHYVTVGKKAAGFVLHVAARSVSRHSLNVMAGHDDVYALLSAGYTVLFGSNAQEAADLAAISYRVSALSLIPVANTMDGFATSHIQSEVNLPEPELLKAFLGAPDDRIPAPTEAQRMLYGAKGRVWQLQQFLQTHQDELWPEHKAQLASMLTSQAKRIETDSAGQLLADTEGLLPEELRGKWRRAWLNAYEKGTRQRVPALVDVHNPGLTGGVQNQPDYQAGIVDHRTHFAADVPRFIHQAMAEYASLTGRRYQPVMGYRCEDAERVVIGLGSVTDDAEAVAEYLRKQGQKVGVLSIKQLQPFPEKELIEQLAGKRVVTVLERCDETRLTDRVTRALFKAQENNKQQNNQQQNGEQARHPGIPALAELPRVCTGIFGLGGHDLQPRHLIAAFDNMAGENSRPLFYLGSQFYTQQATPEFEAVQERLRQAYPETELMALETGDNPHLLPEGAMRIRFHSIGGYGTIATGKLLTDILAGVLGLHSKSMPKYGSEKSGAPTNFFITLSPAPIKITNAELQQVEIVLSPDHKVFQHTNPLNGLAEHGTFILQSHHSPEQVWQALPAQARKTIRDKRISFFVVDAFNVAKTHAPTPDLEIRMMGIAFIGALCGHVEQLAASMDEACLLERIRAQIGKKFGAKGEKVVEGNMQVIRDGLKATLPVPYDDLADPAAETAQTDLKHSIAVSADAARSANRPASCGLFDQGYFDQSMGDRFRDGSIGEAPVLPGSGMFMPPASSVWKEKGLFKLNVPRFDPNRCTGCMECTIACPDAAIPTAVHELHDLLLTAIQQLEIPPAQKLRLSQRAMPISELVRDAIRQAPRDATPPFHQLVSQVVDPRELDNDTERNSFVKLCDSLADLPLSRTRPFFDAMEKALPGTGGLFSVNIDPWKCSGCMECVDVCGPGALSKQRLSSEVNDSLIHSFSLLSQLPVTPQRFIDPPSKRGSELAEEQYRDPKRLLLDRENYYAMTSGHGACRGCGEVTALRLVFSLNRALQQRRYKSHTANLESLIEALRHKLTALEQALADPTDPNRQQRLQQTLAILEKRLYQFETGPTGHGPASALIANATGCSSVYASTFPANPYSDPWVNSLFQDSPAIAKGLFEGEVANQLEQLKALRVARLELEDHYDPDTHDKFFRCFQWDQLSPQELGILPNVFSVGGDGASYDIGFGALSRLLLTPTPIKILVLNTGSYSNTGGQASTASFTAQDSDLSRFGSAHNGKREDRKELGLIAAFHPKVLVIQTSAALQGHFLASLMSYLDYQESPALMDVYTPCLGEQGIGDDASNRHARLAVESRMSPVFVHDPRKGDTLAERFSIDGNPGIGQDWINQTLSYIDDDGITQLTEVPLTAADFALREGRFKKHFQPVTEEREPVPLHEYIDLAAAERHGKAPFIWSTDQNKRLIRLAVSSAIVALTEERRRNWRMLEYLSGLHLDRIEKTHRAELEQWKQRYQDLADEREAAIDALASGMAELALAAGAPSHVAPSPQRIPVVELDSAPANRAGGGKQAEAKDEPTGAGLPLVAIDAAEIDKCTDCKTCYQQLSELFEQTTVMVDGQAKSVSRVIPGALASIEITPELVQRAMRIADECDAEIIHVHAPESMEL